MYTGRREYRSWEKGCNGGVRPRGAGLIMEVGADQGAQRKGENPTEREEFRQRGPRHFEEEGGCWRVRRDEKWKEEM